MNKKVVHSPLRILGIDPGTNVLGYAVIHTLGQQVNLTVMGVLTLTHLDSPQAKLQSIFERVQEIIDQYHPEELAIEAPFFGKNPQSMLKLGRAQGVAIAAAMTKGLPITEYMPKKIKKSVTGNGNASKEQVAAMLGHMLKTTLDNRFFDATDALATAICHHMQRQSPLSNLSKGKGWASFIQDNPDRVV
ncbi:MAG: crossover junction endodeoxyribonuclease RuvC [Saprospirales bacterium]|nr:crossover junction endodeoxyribonuclease RuvC [Saprospirales bacterium]MBK8491592.1 crossover junction endodeoxyribonuclease RuvC [Saprospirales bacterium]